MERLNDFYGSLSVFWKCILVLPLFLQAAETVRCIYSGGWERLYSITSIVFQILPSVFVISIGWMIADKLKLKSKKDFIIFGSVPVVLVNIFASATIILKIPHVILASLTLYVAAVIAAVLVGFHVDQK